VSSSGSAAGTPQRNDAETAQQAALAEGLAPLMGWVKRLADHVTQDLMGHDDLEFAWVDPRHADPAEQAKMLDTYVRSGIYTINEARAALGFDPVAGGDRARIYGAAGAVPLAAPGDPSATPRQRSATTALDKINFNPDQPRVPAGSPDGGQWSGDGGVGSPKLVPAQELLPFAVRPPLFLDEPPEVVRPFKEPIPRLSGKDGAKNVPSWARANRPYVGENGRDFAKRSMDDQYGRGNWEDNPQRWKEYNQLKKYGERAFRDPK
jgi:hypothetical protein